MLVPQDVKEPEGNEQVAQENTEEVARGAEGATANPGEQRIKGGPQLRDDDINALLPGRRHLLAVGSEPGLHLHLGVMRVAWDVGEQGRCLVRQRRQEDPAEEDE